MAVFVGSIFRAEGLGKVQRFPAARQPVRRPVDRPTGAIAAGCRRALESRRLAGTAALWRPSMKNVQHSRKPQKRRRTTMTHARPDVPQPDPIVHDQPGDVPQVPCADELDEHKPGSPYGNQTVVDADSAQPA